MRKLRKKEDSILRTALLNERSVANATTSLETKVYDSLTTEELLVVWYLLSSKLGQKPKTADEVVQHNLLFSQRLEIESLIRKKDKEIRL